MSILLGNVQTANTSLMFISIDLAPDKQCLLVQVSILVNIITLYLQYYIRRCTLLSQTE